MTSLVDELLDAMGIGDTDPELLADIGLAVLATANPSIQRVHRLGLAVLRAALGEILEAVDDEIPVLLLKGEPLEKLLFGGRYPRSTGDIDLLILPGDLEFARCRLAAIGYDRKRDEEPRMWVHNQESWVHKSHGVEVELHWSLAMVGVPALPLSDLFETRVPFVFDDGLEVDILRPDWLFIHLALHFHHHMGFARGLLDIAGWCDELGGDVDLDQLLQTAQKLGLYGIVQWPLHTLANLTTTTPPMVDDDADAVVRSWAKISSRAMRNCMSVDPGGDLVTSLVTIMPRVGAWRAVPLQALTMLTLDGWEQKVRGFGRPFVLGPHRLGRVVSRVIR